MGVPRPLKADLEPDLQDSCNVQLFIPLLSFPFYYCLLDSDNQYLDGVSE